MHIIDIGFPLKMETKTPTSSPSSKNTYTQPSVSFASNVKSSATESAAAIKLTLPRKGGRAKNLLRNYYGLGPDGKKADPLDIGKYLLLICVRYVSFFTKEKKNYFQ